MSVRHAWQYDVTRESDVNSSSMAAMGEMGWELVSAITFKNATGQNEVRLYWKRPAPLLPPSTQR